MITYNNLSFKYNKTRTVFNKFNLTIPKGEIYGLLGHNGAGKSTLFKLTLNLLKPDDGNILLNNDLKISYMPEKGGIYTKLNAFENLWFRARASKLNKNEIRRKSEKILTDLKLINRAMEPVCNWSNGMQKRLALACSIISNPDVILLDEPTNGIDPVSLNIVSELLLKLNSQGVSIIIASHDLNFIKKLASSVVIIQEGTLIYEEKIDNIDLEKVYLEKIGGE